jgi:hypothetical protein
MRADDRGCVRQRGESLENDRMVGDLLVARERSETEYAVDGLDPT